MVPGSRTPEPPGPAKEPSAQVPEIARVCNGLPCTLRGAEGVRRDLEGHGTACSGAACLGYCDHGPVVEREGRYFAVRNGAEVEIEESLPSHVESHRQTLGEYRASGGYSALLAHLNGGDPEDLIARAERAALRGMGGAGFPTHLKLRSLRSAHSQDRVLLVNAHEGEPGTFKDRVLMERNPHLLLEGCLLAALSVGAREIVIATKPEYANAVASLEEALDELKAFAHEEGIADDLPPRTLRIVPGSYVTGEETALIEAVEGHRSEPRLRPPFPTESGLGGRPTLVQNVETLSLLPGLMMPGASSHAPKMFCVSGDVTRPGAYQEPLGITVTELLSRDGGGLPAGLKAFLPGGLSGGILPAEATPLALEFDAVRSAGAGLGTGAVIAIGGDRCILEPLSSIASFFAQESCGKCVPCRLGTRKLDLLVRSLRNGTASEDDVAEGIATAQLLSEASLCALGQAAGKVFRDGMHHFGTEVLAHTRSECPAGRCPLEGS